MVKGINPDALGIIPRNQKDRDYLGVERNKQLRRMRTVSYVAIFLSVVSMATGIAAIVTSAPEFNFPYVVGGGCMTGFVCILMVMVSRKMIREGKKTPTGDLTTSSMSCLGCLQSVLMVIITFVGIMSFGLSGMLGILDCLDAQSTKNKLENPCTPDKEAKLILSVVTAVISILLVIIALTLSCLYCCHQRAFGVKSAHELMLELQETRQNNAIELGTVTDENETTIIADSSVESDKQSIAYDFFRNKFRFVEINDGKVKKLGEAKVFNF